MPLHRNNVSFFLFYCPKKKKKKNSIRQNDLGYLVIELARLQFFYLFLIVPAFMLIYVFFNLFLYLLLDNDGALILLHRLQFAKYNLRIRKHISGVQLIPYRVW